MSFSEFPGFPFGVEATWNTPLKELREALVEHGMILMRHRVLSPEDQVDFSLGFGNLLHRGSPRLARIPLHPEIFVFSNNPDYGSLNNGNYWHSDGAYLRVPTGISIHHVPLCPEDSETAYVDCWALYDTFDAYEIREMEAMHTRSQTGVCQPLVIDFPPAPGRRGLYVNMEKRCVIAGPGGVTSPSMMAELKFRLDVMANRHRWRPGDTIISNALRVCHHSFPCAPAPLRLLHRTTIPAANVFWASTIAVPRGSMIVSSSPK